MHGAIISERMCCSCCWKLW